MDLRSIFFNQHGRLRSGYRFTICIFLMIFIEIFLTMIIRLAYALLHDVMPPVPLADFFESLISRIPLLGAALLAGYFCTRFLDGRPWRALGLSLHQHWLRDLLVGSIIGIGSLALAAAIAVAAGSLKFEINTADASSHIARSIIGTVFVLVIAALAEEAAFRGYPLQTFTRAQLVLVGVLLTSILFAMGHLLNPNVVPKVTFANTFIAGVWLAVAYLRTRSLWFPLGVHWAWNWAMGPLLGIPVSGLRLGGAPLLKVHDVGPAWLTGGSYGLEGGVACTIALVVSTLFLWKTRIVSPTPEMLKLTSEEVSAVQSADTQRPVVQHTLHEDG